MVSAAAAAAAVFERCVSSVNTVNRGVAVLLPRLVHHSVEPGQEWTLHVGKKRSFTWQSLRFCSLCVRGFGTSQ